jgi:hypothetical protein
MAMPEGLLRSVLSLFHLIYIVDLHSTATILLEHFSQVLYFTVTLSEFQIAWDWPIRADIMTIL